MARIGRPVAVPADPNPFDGEHVDVPSRVGWLLRVNRLASDDRDASSLAAFAQRLQGLGLRLDAPRLSGWEQGKGMPPRMVMAGYSRLLGLPSGELRSIADGLSSAFLPHLRLPRPVRGEGTLQRRLDTAYDAVLDVGTPGGDWLALAELLSVEEETLLPTRVLEPPLMRLVSETMRSVGTAYVTRFAALMRLISHPHWGPVVARAVQASVRVPGAQGVVDPISLLGEVGHRATNRWLVRSLRDDTGALQRGAAHSLLNLLIHDLLDPDDLDLLERALHDLGGGTPDAPPVAVMLAERLPVERRLRLGVAEAPVSSSAPAAPEAAAVPAGADRWPRTAYLPFLTAAREVLPDVHDPMVERLVCEALASRYVERRHHASLLLMASAYRAAVAAASVRVAEHGAGPELRQRAAVLLTYVSGPAEQAELTRWLRGRRPELQHAALMSLAHGGGVGPSVDLAALGSRRPLGGSAVYAAGMSGHPVLREWAEGDGSPALRQAARWWLEAGPAVTDAPAA